MQWDADNTDVTVFQTLAGEMEYDYSFEGLKNTEATGFTGDVNGVLPACSTARRLALQLFVSGLKFTNRRSLNG